MYSQNNEEEIILNYFSDQEQGIFLDIGANDGITLSNVRALAEKGWKGCLVEPSIICYEKAKENYKGFQRIRIENCAIGTTTGRVKFYESGSHLNIGDHSLVSSTIEEETKRWHKETFTETEVNQFTFADFKDLIPFSNFDFISIDAEGLDYEILSQINLRIINTKMVCVEHNGKDIQKYIDYCAQFDLHEIHINAENIILAKL